MELEGSVHVEVCVWCEEYLDARYLGGQFLAALLQLLQLRHSVQQLIIAHDVIHEVYNGDQLGLSFQLKQLQSKGVVDSM